jgi:Flp pilus assembly protein TadD
LIVHGKQCTFAFRLRINATVAYDGLAIAHFQRGRYDKAAHAARRALQSVPSFSVSHSLLAAPLAKLGRIEARLANWVEAAVR